MGGGRRENVAGGDDETAAGRREQKGQVENEEMPRWSSAGAKTQPAGNEWNVVPPPSPTPPPRQPRPGAKSSSYIIGSHYLVPTLSPFQLDHTPNELERKK